MKKKLFVLTLIFILFLIHAKFSGILAADNFNNMNYKNYDTVQAGYVQSIYFITYPDTILISLDVTNVWNNAGYTFNKDSNFDFDGNDLIVNMFFESAEITIPVVTETRDTIDLPPEWYCNNNKVKLNALVLTGEEFTDTAFSHYAVEICIITGTDEDYVSDTNYIYPNPADNFIFIHGTETVVFFNYNLRPVKYIDNIKQDGFINISDLCPGLYFVRFRRDNVVHTEKLVISRI